MHMSDVHVYTHCNAIADLMLIWHTSARLLPLIASLAIDNF